MVTRIWSFEKTNPSRAGSYSKPVLDGAGPVQTPAVGGDALGELDLHGAVGREAFEEGFGELVAGGAIIVVTWPVRPWRSAFMRERLRPASLAGPEDRRAFAAVRVQLRFRDHLHLPRGWLPIISYHVRRGKAGVGGRERRTDWRWRIAGIGDAGILDLFSNGVNGFGVRTR
jgi:hypothetical protein